LVGAVKEIAALVVDGTAFREVGAVLGAVTPFILPIIPDNTPVIR